MKFLPLILLIGALALSAQTQGTPNSTAQQPAMQQPATGAQIPASAAIPVIPGVDVPPKGPLSGDARIAREVRHELLMLPYYSVFDDLRYKVNGSTVELLGDVVNSSLRSMAESSVRKIEGVTNVINNIKVLPPSPMDDRIRVAVARAVFGADGLSRYGWEAAPSIHIIADGGHVRLVGVVDSEADRNLAGIKAQGVPGVFSVKNEMLVASNKS